MKKFAIIHISIFIIIIIVLCSLRNVVGYQEDNLSGQKILKEEVNQKELLFQIILDIAHNKDVQRLLYTPEINRERFFDLHRGFLVYKPYVLTRNELNSLYRIGSIFLNKFNAAKIHLIYEHYNDGNEKLQEEINVIIDNDPILKKEMALISSSKCNCENDNTTQWNFPIFCFLLAPLAILAWLIYFAGGSGSLGTIVYAIGGALHCFWA